MKWLFLPLVLFLLWIPFSAAMDVKVTSSFYGVDGFLRSPFLSALTHYGELPGHLLIVGSAFLWFFTFYRPSWQRARTAALAVALVGLLGVYGGVHLLKEVYGRPRPREVMEFGGSARFRPVYYAPTWHVPNDNYKSFPSGHAAMGMLFITLGLVSWKERWYIVAFFGFFLGLAYSFALGYSRIAQGAHFLSDVLASFVGIWTLSILCVMLLYPSAQTKRAPIKKPRNSRSS